MRQTLHLLILDVDRRCALVGWHGVRWILPILDLPQRARAAPAVCAWLAARGLPAHVAGQWIGRLAASVDTVDWLAVACVRDSSSMRATELAWAPLLTLLSSVHMVDYQRWALTATTPTGGEPLTDGPFGHTRWIDEAGEFVRRAIGTARQEVSVVPHRIASSELVVEYRSERDRYFLKGLARERVREASFTMKMHELAPQFFAGTVAFMTRPDGSAWWLMEACAGVPLASVLSVHAAEAAAVAYARLQQLVLVNDWTRLAIPLADLASVPTWAAGLLDDAGKRDEAEHCRGVLQAANRCVDDADLPHSWIAGDLDPLNVLVNGDEIRFIDLDDALWGPAPIGVSIFARRIRRTTPEYADGVRTAYERAWSPGPSAHCSRSATDLMSKALECRLGWNRLTAQTALGEVHDLVEPARQALAARLVRMCDASKLSGAA